jgi:serine protease Do
MNKRTLFAAVALISIGIIFGALLVSGLQGVGEGIAAFGGDVKLGSQASPLKDIPEVKSLEDAYVSVANSVRPTVVSIQATTKQQSSPKSKQFDQFFHFFGPDFQFKMPEEMPSRGFGSGVIVTSDGYIITNNHVVENADEGSVKVKLVDTREFDAKVAGTDPLTDIAVIKIDAKDLPVAALGNSDELRIGQMVMAIGNPFNLNFTVTHGIISALGRDGLGLKKDSYGIENFIQTDAVINPGNSGGALVNLHGEVIGINAAIATRTGVYEGYGFAIPMNLVKSVAEDLIKNGKVRRGYIGVQIGNVDATMAKANGLDKARGVLVQSLTEGGAASEAGIKEGDIILSINGKEVNTANELQTYVASKHPGDIVTLNIWRDKKTTETKVKLRERKESSDLAKNDEEGDNESADKETDQPRSKTFDNLGLTVRNMNGDLKEKYKTDYGVLITDVKKYSHAEDQLQKNFVIIEADRKKVRSVSDLEEILKEKKPGDAIMLRVKDTNGNLAYRAIEIPKESK